MQDSTITLMGSIFGALLAGGLIGYLLRLWQNRELTHRAMQAQSQVHSLSQQLSHLQTTLAERENMLTDTRQQLLECEKALAALNATHHEKMAAQTALQQSLDQAGEQLRMQFQNLANQILEEKGRSLSQHHHTALDALLAPLREQLQGFAQRVNEVHTESVKGQSALGAEIRQVREVGLKMSADAHNLTRALKNEKKTLGNWGEFQLEHSLQAAGLMPEEHYQSQASLRDEGGTLHRPDFIVKLPDDKCLVLDSKVSLVDFARAVATELESERQQALDAHVKAIRNHIDDLASKDYARLLGVKSPDFVLMFLPVESAYLAALQHQPQLFDYGYQRQVVMVSHTTLLPILKTVANVWRLARSNEHAHQLSTLASDVYAKMVEVAERLKKLGNTLQAASNQYNDTVTALAGRQGLYGKAQRFTELSVKTSKHMPDFTPLDIDLHKDRLNIIQPDTTPISTQEPQR